MAAFRVILFALAVSLGGCASTVPEQPAPEATSPHAADFGALAQLAGTRWHGEPGGADAAQGQPADYSEWYWDLGGTVLVSRHVLDDGSYGGVTYIQKNAATGALDYVYITSAGFRTSGSFALSEDGSWSAEEAVEGHPTIDRVRSTSHVEPDGSMVADSEFHSAEGWSPGHSFHYRRTDAPLPALVPGATVPE